ncbi:MAG: hypothetical protein Q8M95_12440, partial [Candidatus Methanoperedens sp.]|nr:hypothetical protein [Candidatus Methanoperedens sp.]
MQVCITCEESTRCGLKDKEHFDLCPKLKNITKVAEPQVPKENTTPVIDKEILKKHFGYSEFRHLQQDIINDVLKGNDVLVLMP